MKIVFLDRNTIGSDIDVSFFTRFGELKEYDSCSPDKSAEYIKEADVVIFNKTVMNGKILDRAPNVKLLCVTATGYDNIDIEYCKKRKGRPWRSSLFLLCKKYHSRILDVIKSMP